MIRWLSRGNGWHRTAVDQSPPSTKGTELWRLKSIDVTTMFLLPVQLKFILIGLPNPRQSALIRPVLQIVWLNTVLTHSLGYANGQTGQRLVGTTPRPLGYLTEARFYALQPMRLILLKQFFGKGLIRTAVDPLATQHKSHPDNHIWRAFVIHPPGPHATPHRV
jgi:hypothetical protein